MRVDLALRSWIDTRLEQAVRSNSTGHAQEGNRPAVTGGKHLNAIDRLVQDELAATGARGLELRVARSAVLPGYYRPTKAWDLRKLLGGPGGPDVAYGFLPSVAPKEWPSGSPGRPGC